MVRIMRCHLWEHAFRPRLCAGIRPRVPLSGPRKRVRAAPGQGTGYGRPGQGADPDMLRARDHVIAVGPGPGFHVLVCGPQ